jgi:hypothetical protein
METADPRLRALHKLAETAEGEDLERVRVAIVERRRELALDEPTPSAWTGLPDEEPSGPGWSPPADAFRPAPSDAVPARARRPGERGYRIVGTKKAPPPDA